MRVQLETLRYFPESTNENAKELVEFVQSLSATMKTFIPQVIMLVKILLVMPATNGVSEQSFSAMKRVKTHLRSTTSHCQTEPFDGPSCPQRQNRQLEYGRSCKRIC